jgi:hypothetical protein
MYKCIYFDKKMGPATFWCDFFPTTSGNPDGDLKDELESEAHHPFVHLLAASAAFLKSFQF